MKDWVLALGLGVVALAVGLCLASRRPGLDRVWGDEPTYLAMIASVARDGDLRFTEPDRLRAEAGGQDTNLILQHVRGRVSYSKPILYALFSAPLFLLLGAVGPVVANVVAVCLSLLLAFAYLRRLGPPGRAALTLVTFVGTSTVPVYLLWRMTESLDFALVLAGLVLCVGEGRARAQGSGGAWLSAPWTGVVGGVLLGLAASMRYPNAALVAAPVVTALVARRPLRAARVLVGAAAGLVAVMLVTYAMTGAVDPYRATRATFSAATGFPSGPGDAAARRQFALRPATNNLDLRPGYSDPRVTAYAGLYFFVGRQSGLVVYLPAALPFAFFALRQRDRAGQALLLAAAVIAVFYAVWMPRYFFGGATAVGNRYFMSAYPALLLALATLPPRRILAVPWLVAGIVAGSAWVSMDRTRGLEFGSQTHTVGGIFRWLPYESVVIETEGHRDRYWSGSFIRFVDPFAEVAPWHFELRSDRPPAELLVARSPYQIDRPIQFLIDADAPAATVHVADFRRSRRHELRAPVGASRVQGLVEVDRRPAWRSHAYWWVDRASVEGGQDRDGQVVPYPTRLFRLAVTSPDGRPVTATLRYLAGTEPLSWAHDREVLGVELPTQAQAGSVSLVRVRVRNTGARTWTSAEVFPLQLSYRIRRPGTTAVLAEGERVDIPGRIAPGGTLEADVPIRWPDAPGQYDVAVDLLVEGLQWFEDRLGEPLECATVTVEPPQ